MPESQMDGVSYVYHKSIEAAVKKYALCSNPRDGAVSRTYFPPSSYELSQQSAFIHKELNRRAGFQRRKVQTVIDSGRHESTKREKSSKLPPIRLSERILDDYEPGKVFQESILPNHQSPRFNDDKTLALASLEPIKQYLAPLKSLGKRRGKSEMQLRFEMEEEYINRMRLNKKLTTTMSHRMERFYYLQGGMANLSSRERNALSLPPPSQNFSTKQHDVINEQNAFITQQNTESDMSPITHVTTHNIDRQIMTPTGRQEDSDTPAFGGDTPVVNTKVESVELENDPESAVGNETEVSGLAEKPADEDGAKNDGTGILNQEADNLDDSRISLAEPESARKEEPGSVEVVATSDKIANEENESEKQDEKSETNSVDDPKEMQHVNNQLENAETADDNDESVVESDGPKTEEAEKQEVTPVVEPNEESADNIAS